MYFIFNYNNLSQEHYFPIKKLVQGISLQIIFKVSIIIIVAV